MGGKVIKINLVGAIFTIFLIVAVIVGIVIFATRDTGNSSKSDNQKDNKPNVIQDDKDSYKELDRKDTVYINGTAKEILMKTYVRESEYRIDYDVNTFYINEINKEEIFIESNISDTILMKISKKNDFYKISNELITNESNKKKADTTYKLNTRDYNGHLAYIESKETDKDVRRTYYIENKDEYYVIDVMCGNDYKENVMPIIDKMVETFKIM